MDKMGKRRYKIVIPGEGDVDDGVCGSIAWRKAQWSMP
jgi:hypothetical protein